MLAFIQIFIFAEGGVPHWWEPYEPYLNYPGFEAWKFINLGIFVAVMIYLLKKPLSAAFKAKREAIRADLIKAEEERQAALAQLTATEAKLAALETEKAHILQRAQEEAETEKRRLAVQTEFEVSKLREQNQAEISRLSQQARAELRRYSADESIRLAEEKLKARINSETDARLIKNGIQAIGGLN